MAHARVVAERDAENLAKNKQGNQEKVGHRRGPEAVPVVRPRESRNVVVPAPSRVAVPVVLPLESRKVRVPALSVVIVPTVLPLASRTVVC